jgi:hypothetical protein
MNLLLTSLREGWRGKMGTVRYSKTSVHIYYSKRQGPQHTVILTFAAVRIYITYDDSVIFLSIANSSPQYWTASGLPPSMFGKTLSQVMKPTTV